MYFLSKGAFSFENQMPWILKYGVYNIIIA